MEDIMLNIKKKKGHIDVASMLYSKKNITGMGDDNTKGKYNFPAMSYRVVPAEHRNTLMHENQLEAFERFLQKLEPTDIVGMSVCKNDELPHFLSSYAFAYVLFKCKSALNGEYFKMFRIYKVDIEEDESDYCRSL